MENEKLTMGLVADQPWRATQTVMLRDGEPILYRPLLPDDVDGLTEFLESLSPRTRHFWDLASYDRNQAEQTVVLWGGVFQENVVAVHFYKKHGFRIAGMFQEGEGRDCFDMFLSLDST